MLKSEPLKKQVKVTFTVSQHQHLNQIAQEKDISLAELLRDCVGVKLKDHRKRIEKLPEKTEIKIDTKFRYELHKINLDINSMVKAMYKERAVPQLHALSQIIKKLEELDTKITKSIRNKK